MATTTRPRQKSIEELLDERSEMKRIITTAKRKITMVMNDPELNRSTRDQRVHRIKAASFDALDERL